MYSLPSPHIRDTLEVTEMERSNPPRSDFKGFGEKIRTTVKDSVELPKSSATSRILSQHLMKQRAGRRRSD